MISSIPICIVGCICDVFPTSQWINLDSLYASLTYSAKTHLHVLYSCGQRCSWSDVPNYYSSTPSHYQILIIFKKICMILVLPFLVRVNSGVMVIKEWLKTLWSSKMTKTKEYTHNKRMYLYTYLNFFHYYL